MKLTDKRVLELEKSHRAMINLLDDFEEEKKKRETLTRDLEKFKLALDNISDQVVIADAKGIMLYANKTVMEKITGYKIEDAIGKKAGVLWKTPMPKEYYKKFWHTIKTEKKSFVGEIKNKRKNGEVYTATLNVSPVLDKDGKLLFFIGIERDITKEKEIDRAKSEFLAIASHELRTPLTAIDGLISMILDGEYGAITENIRQPLKDTSSSSERLIHLVNDLLSLSRMQAGKMKYALSCFNIDEVIKNTVHLLQPLSIQKGLDLTATKLDSSIVSGDLDKVKEILNNLIGNAINFTDKGSIIVSTKVDKNMVEISITDTGIGIAKEDISKLFGQFQQLGSGQGNLGSTGLGLNISKEMARKMGGDLWLEKTEVGVGSTFVFAIPKSN